MPLEQRVDDQDRDDQHRGHRGQERHLCGPDAGSETLQLADLTLDPSTREVTRGCASIELTRTEFSLLELFLRNPKQVLTRSIIFERVWGYDRLIETRSVDVHVGRLRGKLGNAGKQIETVVGLGYRFVEVE